VGSRLESDRGRRNNLGANHLSGISFWGHTREGQTIVGKLTQFKTGAASLLRDEDVVPALAGLGIPDH
jgi:hypothetical protein